MLYTITNSFHGTKAKTKYDEQDRDNIAGRVYYGEATDAERKAMRRAKNKLCGSSTCTCSNDWGER